MLREFSPLNGVLAGWGQSNFLLRNSSRSGWQELALNDRHSEAFQAMVVENKTSGRQAMHIFSILRAMPSDAKANDPVREVNEVSKTFPS